MDLPRLSRRFVAARDGRSAGGRGQLVRMPISRTLALEARDLPRRPGSTRRLTESLGSARLAARARHHAAELVDATRAPEPAKPNSLASSS